MLFIYLKALIFFLYRIIGRSRIKESFSTCIKVSRFYFYITYFKFYKDRFLLADNSLVKQFMRKKFNVQIILDRNAID